MKRLSPLLFLLLTMAALPGAALAQDTFNDGLDPAIHTVVTGGTWQQEGRYGNVRVVVRNEGWEHTRSFVYVQWLLSDEKTRQVRELLTLPVSAVNESGWVNVQTLELIGGGENTRVRIRYLLRGEDGVKEGILAIGPPGEVNLIR